MIYKMDFHYNQQLYKKHDKCKHIKEKKKNSKSLLANSCKHELANAN